MSCNCQSVLLQDWTLFYNLETNGLSLPCHSRKELSDLWDKCFFGPAQREEFTPAFDGMCGINTLCSKESCSVSSNLIPRLLSYLSETSRRETWE